MSVLAGQGLASVLGAAVLMKNEGSWMNVLICLKNVILGEALYELLNGENNGEFHVDVETRHDSDCGTPDIIIVDHKTANLKYFSLWPEAKMILLDTGLHQDEVIALILMYRLHGVIPQEDDVAMMKKALKLVNEGQIWINNSHLKALLQKAGNFSRIGRVESISRREKDILGQLVQGKKNKEIAAQLFMSEQTVKAHISHIFKKFNVSSRTQLISHLMKTPFEIMDNS
jgi:DNA-binding NarL/FixJ family response regulator